MGRPDGAHTHGDGSGGKIALVVGAAILAAAIAGPVAHAAAELLHIVVISVAVVIGLALTGGTALLAYRARHGRSLRALPVHWAQVLPRQAAEPLKKSRRPAIGAPKQERHLHFHGVTAEDVAAIIARHNGRGHG